MPHNVAIKDAAGRRAVQRARSSPASRPDDLRGAALPAGRIRSCARPPEHDGDHHSAMTRPRTRSVRMEDDGAAGARSRHAPSRASGSSSALLDADGWAWAVGQGFALAGRSSSSCSATSPTGRTTSRSTGRWSSASWSGRRSTSARRRTRRCRARRRSARSSRGSRRPRSSRLPQPRTDGVGHPARDQVPVHRRVRRRDRAVDTVYVAHDRRAPATSTSGRRARRCPSRGPTPASLLVSGSIYVIGGRDAAGAPTDTIFVLTPDPTTGRSGRVGPRRGRCCCPRVAPARPAVGRADRPPADRRPNADGPVDDDLEDPRRPIDGRPRRMGRRRRRSSTRRPTRRRGRSATTCGCMAARCQRPGRRRPAWRVRPPPRPRACPTNPNEGKVVQWAVNDAANLPAARDDASTWTANGAHLPGRWRGRQRTQGQLYWAIPTTDGDIPEWKHLAVSDLPFGLTGGAPVIVGSECDPRRRRDDRRCLDLEQRRANMAPLSPFFQLGIARRDHPGPQDRGRDRPAARLPRTRPASAR